MDVIDMSLSLTPVGKGKVELGASRELAAWRDEKAGSPIPLAQDFYCDVGSLEQNFTVAIDPGNVGRHDVKVGHSRRRIKLTHRLTSRKQTE
jgi:hypothetical protein